MDSKKEIQHVYTYDRSTSTRAFNQIRRNVDVPKMLLLWLKMKKALNIRR